MKHIEPEPTQTSHGTVQRSLTPPPQSPSPQAGKGMGLLGIQQRKLIKQHPWGIALVAAYLVLAVAYSIVNPIHEATDELRHYRYVRYIADFGQLPVQSEGEGNAQAHHPPLYYATAALLSLWVHPADPLAEPLHNPHWGYHNWEVGVDNKNMYLHGPDEAWPYRDAALAAHLARLATVLWGAAAVAATYALARVAFPQNLPAAVAGTAFVAFCPMFLYLGGAVNNDVPAGLMGTAITLMALLAIRDGLKPRVVVLMGVLYGLAALTKFNLVAMLAVIELALVLGLLQNPTPNPSPCKGRGGPAPTLSRREGGEGFSNPPTRKPARPFGRFVGANAVILGMAVMMAGWWYVRNVVLYGEPTGFLRLTEIWGVRDPSAGVALTIPELSYAWTSLWARFGYGQIPLPLIYYRAVGVVAGLATVGLIVALVTSRARGNSGLHSDGFSHPLPALRATFPRQAEEGQNDGATKQRAMSRDGSASLPRGTGEGRGGGVNWRMIALLAASALLNLGVLYAYITVSPAGAMGRFFFPGFPALAVLWGYGLTEMLPKPARWGVAGLVGAGMLGFALVGLVGYLAPAYAIPRAIVPEVEPAVSIPLGDAARILDYRVAPTELYPGETLEVTVTWETLRPTDVPYAVFVHVINPQGVMVAQRDTYTGLGNYPSAWWRAGHIFRETYRIDIPETAYTPDTAAVSIGLYHPDLGRLPIEDPDVRDDALPLAEVALLADPDAPYPNPQFQDFEGRFALVGYTMEPRAVAPGGAVTVRLYWQALDPPEANYNVFLHVRQGWDLTIAGNDGFPNAYPPETRTWEPGEVYVDERVLTIGENAPPGLYEVEAGLFSDEDGRRLYIVAADGHIIDDWLPLSPLPVTAP